MISKIKYCNGVEKIKIDPCVRTCFTNLDITTNMALLLHIFVKAIKKEDENKYRSMIPIELFPKIENVFLDNFEQNQKHFMPLATIDMALADKSLVGKIHLVYYNDDPYCEETVEFLNDFCDEDKASFDMIDGKYRFKADFGFFKTNDDWIEWLEIGRKSYNDNVQRYHGEEYLDAMEVIKNLGGKPEWIQDEQWPTDTDGEDLIFICQAWSADFVTDYCEEIIYLFYDPKNQIAVQIHQVD